MIGCFLIGKDTSVCVRFLSDDSDHLIPWKEKFEGGACHVHRDSTDLLPKYELDLKNWLNSTACASALLLLDARSKQILETSFLDLCKKAKKQGVFIGVFVENEDSFNDKIVNSYQPNWILRVNESQAVMQAKVNELLGVVRFSKFSPIEM